MAARRPSLLALVVLGGALVSLVAGLLAGPLWAAVTAAIAFVGVLVSVAWSARPEADPGRRRLLASAGVGGLVTIVGGGSLGSVVHRLLFPTPEQAMHDMAENLGAEGLELMVRTYRSGRSGDLQLVLTPGSTSNYASESRTLLHRDPRSSHALPWLYLERVPIVVWDGGARPPSDHVGRVTLADLAPTIASIIGFADYDAPDGRPLPGIAPSATPPKVLVTFVIDGGGWNVLDKWPGAWPNMKRLMGEGAVYRNAIMGSSPAVTACAHATIGTGAFPRTHGITGHNIRDGRSVRKAYGTPGSADPADILMPTLADRWVDANDGNVWVGEIGYQIWHLGMLGRGGRPLGDRPVAVYWDDDVTSSWQPQNPGLYRLPKDVPPRSRFERERAAYRDPGIDDVYARFLTALTEVCCSPPIIRYQGDLIEATIRSEALGTHAGTDLLFVNYKAPDYTGHVYNMLSPREEIALRAVDVELGRLAQQLLATYGAGNFALIVTADHGQCPTVDTTEGVRLDPTELQKDIEFAFGNPTPPLVQSVVPSEVYLDAEALRRANVTPDDIAAFLHGYRYGDNIGSYVHADAIERDRLDERPFAAVLSTDFLDRMRGEDLGDYGDGRMWTDADPTGVPSVSW